MTTMDAGHDFHLPHSRDGDIFLRPKIDRDFGIRGVLLCKYIFFAASDAIAINNICITKKSV